MNLANVIRQMGQPLEEAKPPFTPDKMDFASAAKKVREYAKKSGGIDRNDMLRIASELDALSKKASPQLLARTMRNIQDLDTDVRDKIKELMKEDVESLGELIEAMVRGKEVFDKTFANQKQADEFAKKNGGRVRQVGRVFYVFKEANDEDEAPASPDEKSMALRQAEFIQYVGEEIEEYLEGDNPFPEWMQNKLTALHESAEGVHSAMAGRYDDDDDEEELDESDEAKFHIWSKKSQELQKMRKDASAKLQKFPKGNMGLVPDSIKKTPEFKKANSDYEKIAQAERKHNTGVPKKWLRMASDIRRKGMMKEETEMDEAYKTPAEAGAYEAGKKAAREGKKYQDNPNKKGTAEFTAWSKGHNEARAKGMNEAKSSTGYDLYHRDFSSAMSHAYKHAKEKLGIEIDPKEIDDKVASGPRKPSAGKTNTYRLKGKDGKKAVQIQVYGMDNGKYELNMYKESVELDEAQRLFMFKTKAEADKKAKEVNGKVVPLTKQNFAVVVEEVEMDMNEEEKRNKMTVKVVEDVDVNELFDEMLSEEVLVPQEKEVGMYGLSKSLLDAVRGVVLGEAKKEALDPVNKKALKKDFDDRDDKDIDNDGDVDDSDEYLHKRRQAISKAIKKDKKDEEDDGTEPKEPIGKSGKQMKVDTKPSLDEAEMSDAEMKKRGVKIVFNKILNGWFIVRGAQQTPISGRFDSREAALAHLRRRNKPSLDEAEMSDAEMKKREEIVKSMKDKEQYFKDKYGDRAKEVMYATATKMAKKQA